MTVTDGFAIEGQFGVDLTPEILASPALRAGFGSLPQFHGVRYVAYGHSFGQVQNPRNAWDGSLYPARVRDLLHADPALYANRTQSGTTMTQVAQHLTDTWVGGEFGLVSLLGNQNSAGQGQSEADFKAAVRSFLTTLTTAAAVPTILVVKDVTCTPVGYARYGGGAYNDAKVATYNGWLTAVVAEFPDAPIVVADPMADGWNAATMTAPDGQHPNDYGSAHLAASCLRALAAAPYRGGLNYGYPPRIYVADNFDRADSGSLGTTPVGGKVWTLTDPNMAYGIKNQQAYRATGGTVEAYALVDVGHADVDVSVTLASVSGNGCGQAWRATDASNLWVMDCNSGDPITVYKKTAGAFTAVAGTGAFAQPGDVVRVVVVGSAGTVYVNGVQKAMFSDAFNATATKHGLRITEQAPSVSRLDNFSVAAP